MVPAELVESAKMLPRWSLARTEAAIFVRFFASRFVSIIPVSTPMERLLTVSWLTALKHPDLCLGKEFTRPPFLQVRAPPLNFEKHI